MAVEKKFGKIDLIFLFLVIANLIFFIGLIQYYCYVTEEIILDLDLFNKIFAMLASIIILGFISTRLPQFRNLGDSSIYEIGYLVVIGLFSIIISYFNESTHTKAFFTPFLEMFKVLSVMLIFTLIAAKSKAFKERMNGKSSKKGIITSFFIFVILGILATQYTVPVNDSFANVRSLVMMIGGLFAGPYAGIPAALVVGMFRLLQGGATALPCSIATVIAGVFGGLIHYWNGGKFIRTKPAILLMFLFTGFEMLLILMLTPPSISFAYIQDIYSLMLFASVLGMILFVMIIKEESSKVQSSISYEDFKFQEYMTVLEEVSDKVDNLEDEIEELKNKDN